MKNPWLIPAATLTLGVLGGFIAGKTTSSSPAPDSDDSPVARIRSQARAEIASTDGKRPAAKSKVRSGEDAFRTQGQTDRIQALLDFYSGLSPEQFEAEAVKLQDLPMAERLMASFLLFGKWAETDPTAAMAYAGKMGMQGNFMRPTILQSWASSDPQGAAEYYANNPREFSMMGMMGGGRGPMGGGSGASVIAGEWAKQDPTAAMAWANSLTGNDKNSAMSGVIGTVASSDPAKAWSMVAQMDAESQSRAYRDIAEKWAAKDFAEAERQIASLPADQQAAAMSAALEGLAKKDPQQAVLKLASIPAGESRDDATRTAVDYWSRTNAKEAAAWVAASADESAQAGAMRELMPNYVAQDPQGALAFANSLPAGEARDSALSSYLFSNREMPAAQRVQLAQGIGDETSRSRTMTAAAAAWQREDPKAANEFIQSSDAFSEEAKTRAAAGESIWSRGGPGGGGPGGGGPGGGRGGR
jgi:hypothetical protein